MAEVYNTDRFAELYYPSNTADLLQLGLAARFVAMLFESNQVTYAFIGGWAVYLRGGRRRTQDIDITVATTMDHLKQILMVQPRYDFASVVAPSTHCFPSVILICVRDCVCAWSRCY